jgi:hypothetical protein
MSFRKVSSEIVEAVFKRSGGASSGGSHLGITYVPMPSLEHEMGVMWGFIGSMIIGQFRCFVGNTCSHHPYAFEFEILRCS